MHKHEHYTAQLAAGSVIPTFLCGHCNSTLSKGRIFANDGENRHDLACHTIGLCSADDCGAVNCCDDAMGALNSEQQYRKAAG
ncbi:MAG: hypothetical protein CL581_07640 [Alteromonadaceae bacterium]|uniref:hypothetical protein n=1 Tax=unclassified Marinobacter TaxID=83889 RepID=UPI000C4EFAEF|nr:hypothetical protein [Marinobacter sp. BGYM27]MAA64632.1 hypothetical protein [Alteromonadaceae bacterium]MBH84664.1 hypothetical protein [Alteromonadaceae bacterium]MDG5498137.1 hypothetical protein [Marinobacter sp. BGYM27]|tara:strand:+ start:60885 stop:61133 length:249 start_codon:yes stop_codon:yes gene_type:complete